MRVASCVHGSSHLSAMPAPPAGLVPCRSVNRKREVRSRTRTAARRLIVTPFLPQPWKKSRDAVVQRCERVQIAPRPRLIYQSREPIPLGVELGVFLRLAVASEADDVRPRERHRVLRI